MKLNEEQLSKVMGGYIDEFDLDSSCGPFQGFVKYSTSAGPQLFSTQAFMDLDICKAFTQAKASELANQFKCSTQWAVDYYESGERSLSSIF